MAAEYTPDALVALEKLNGTLANAQVQDDAYLTANPVVNLLTANQSSFETSVANFSGDFYWEFLTATRDTTVFEDGVASMKLAVTAANEAQNCYIGLNGIPVKQGTVYTWHARVFAPQATFLDTSRFFNFQPTSPDPFGRFAQLSTDPLYSLPAGWSTIGGTGSWPEIKNGTVALIFSAARKADNSAFDSTVPIYVDKVQVEEWHYRHQWVLGAR